MNKLSKLLSARRRAISAANRARDRRDPARATSLYRSVIRRWGARFEVLVQLGNALKDSGAFGEAEQAYNSALELRPDDADCHLQLGHLMKVSGRIEQARTFYLEANRLDPKLAGAACEIRPLLDQLQIRHDELQDVALRLQTECDQLRNILVRTAADRDELQDAVSRLTTERDSLLDRPEGDLAPRALGHRLANIRLLVMGTCQVGHLAVFAPSLGYTADHLVFGSERHAAIPTVNCASYDAGVVGLTLRHLLFEASSGPMDLSHLRGWDAATAAGVLDRCRGLMLDRITSLHDAIKGLPTFFLSFLEPGFSYLGNMASRDDPLSVRSFVRRLNHELALILSEFPDFYFVDHNEILNLVGRMHVQDDRLLHATHASFLGEWNEAEDSNRLALQPSDLFGVHTGNQLKKLSLLLLSHIADNIKILRRIDTVKLIIVDLDDTLWRGVAAEESAVVWSRVEGWPLGFVEALLYFKGRGGLLAICSKNDQGIALGKLREIWGNRITIDDFASLRINWNSKSENIANILHEVNLLPDNVLFIDDNPREIDEVRSWFPTMRCLGGSHYDWRRIILCAPETQVPVITAESLQRTRLVRARIERENTARTMNRADWLQSLEIKQTFALATSTDHPLFARAMELINKTNQFNTTGKRWSSAEFAELFDEGGVCLLSSLRDKTVDNGMTGVVLVKGREIKQAVLSCRVFGLGAETGMARIATRIALTAGERATARIIDTGKNFACHDYFRNAGFTDANGLFEAAQPCQFPAWIETRFVNGNNDTLQSEEDWLACFEAGVTDKVFHWSTS